jgi:dipeptidase E
MSRQIVAMGGGGFSMEPDRPALDDYVLSLSPGRQVPRVCFVPTASGDSESYCDRFRQAFPPSRATASVLSLFKREVVDVADFLASQDVIYVGGGNTANLLAVWRLHGVDEAIRQAYAEGVVLAGVSAGMNCWFRASITDSFDVNDYARLDDGLGLLTGSACPHYDAEQGRKETFHSLVQGGFPAGYAVNDSAALHFVDEHLTSVVSSVPGRSAYVVRKGDEGVASETRLDAVFLPSPPR